MSGGPPHHPHNRQVPAANLANPAWNHRLQIPNYFPRQPQLAHMSNEHSLLHQPSWHTPTTEALKLHPHTHVLSEMFKNESLFPRDCVDLSLARNGNQNGEVVSAPISLSVRDTNKINSLHPSALEIQAVELTKSTSPVSKPTSPAVTATSPGRKSLSPGLKSVSPGLRTVAPYPKANSPGLISTNPLTANIFSPSSSLVVTPRNISNTVSPVPKSLSPGLKPSSPGLKSSLGIQGLPSSTTVDIVKTQKRSNIRVDSILERLNPTAAFQESKFDEKVNKPIDEPPPISVIVQPTGSFDENSNSSSILNVPVNLKDDDTVSTNSNEDSLDSTKSRRKRKPSKTIRVSKDDEKVEEVVPVDTIDGTSKEPMTEPAPERDPISIMLEDSKIPEKGESSADLEELIPVKPRRKTSSESETIDDIAAMVQEGLKEKEQKQQQTLEQGVDNQTQAKPISVSVIKTKENLTDVLSDTSNTPSPSIVTPTAKKTNAPFLEVEDKLEEMFAGIEDSSDPLKTSPLDLDDSKTDDPFSKLEDPLSTEETKEADASIKPDEIEKITPNIDDTEKSSKLIVETNTANSSAEEKNLVSPKKSKRKATGSAIELTPKKKKVCKTTKANNIQKGGAKKVQKPKTIGRIDLAKDIYAYDSGSNTSSTKSRGPFIQIKGPRDSPVAVNVINSSITDEDGERKLPKSKKYHDDIEYRQKVRSKGLHSSTLSTKYDAQTKDTTWICAFCKRGPHASELSGPTSDRNVIPPGDLFGPYFITTQCPEFARRLDDPYDRQFKSKKLTKALDAEVAPHSTKGKKSKRKHSDSDCMSTDDLDIYLGITETGNKTYEVWAHEDCIVWSQGIYLIGAKIVGLEEAVWTCCNITCKSCSLKGANILCLRRGCLNVMHICCARSNNWQFLESSFKAYCPEHQIP